MIGRLTGTVDDGVVMVGGIGFDVRTAAPLPEGEQVTLETHMAVRENDITLYGFTDRLDRALFETLCGVPSVGAKTALALLSDVGRATIAAAVHNEDAAPLTAASGVGAASARKILANLAGKLPADVVAAAEQDTPADPAAVQAAVDGLVHLGTDRDEARRLVHAVADDSNHDDANALLQQALLHDS